MALDERAFVAEWTAALAATYGWSVNQNWGGQFSLSYTHLEAQLGQFGSPSPGGSRDLLRARFGFPSGSWGYFVFGNNLLNENDAINAQTPVGGLRTFTRDYPTQVGVEVTFDFW